MDTRMLFLEKSPKWDAQMLANGFFFKKNYLFIFFFFGGDFHRVNPH